MGQMTDMVEAWAKQQADESELRTSADGNNASLIFSTSNQGDFKYRAYCDVDESEQIVELFLYAPITIAKDKRHAVADAVARINIKVFHGRIDLNMDDGKLRFRFGLSAGLTTFTVENLSYMLDNGTRTLDKYLPAISGVIYAGTSPANALAKLNDVAPDDSAALSLDIESPPAWDSIAGADMLQPWAQELQSAIAAVDAEEWRDVGRAVLLVSDNEIRCQAALMRVAKDAGMRFVTIENADVLDLPPRAAFASAVPALVFLVPGRWLLDRQNADSDDDANKFGKFQQRLVQWIEAFDVSQPVVLCSMVYQLGDMSDTLDGAGRFDRYFALPPISHAMRGTDFIERLGVQRCGQSITTAPDKLGKLLDDKYKNEERCDLALLYLRRLSKRVKRPLEFLDLMHMSTHGFGEEGRIAPSNEDIRYQLAVHEAGHAAMAILDSAGRNVPDYCSIVPGVDFKGVVAESIGYHQSLGERMTYADFRHAMRICLAGRAAEELILGAERVSNGASGDLETVWKRCMRAFTRWGFAPQMEYAQTSASNLAVVVGDPTPSESAYAEGLIRQFLAKEYPVVLNCLAENQDFLSVITQHLLQTPIVDQTELAAIYHVHLKQNA